MDITKEEYHKRKGAYKTMVNGCGGDCFECEKNECVSDNPEVRLYAERWLKQKQYERDFYARNRERRSKAALSYYNRVVKKGHSVATLLQEENQRALHYSAQESALPQVETQPAAPETNQ